MKLTPQDLKKIADLTLEHYNQRAEEFWQGTRNHDVSQNIAALLQYIEGEPPFTILDFGCGPGRDLKVFAELGHIAVGLEGAAQFAAMARANSGCEVWQQDFLELDLPDDHFDGVFANAALFHVPSQELPRVLLELHASLKPGGVLFSSNPRGHNEEGWNGGRYGAYHDLDAWRRYVSAAGFVELITIIALPDCRANSSPGWRASGAAGAGGRRERRSASLVAVGHGRHGTAGLHFEQNTAVGRQMEGNMTKRSLSCLAILLVITLGAQTHRSFAQAQAWPSGTCAWWCRSRQADRRTSSPVSSPTSSRRSGETPSWPWRF